MGVPTVFATKVARVVRRNSPTILTGLGISGVVTTAYLAGKASYEAAIRIQAEERRRSEIISSLTTKDKAEMVWKLYIPAGVSGALAIGCIVAAAKTNARRTAAITAAYSLTEKAFSEYREKIVETLGERKEKTIRDQIVQDTVDRNPPNDKEVIIAGSGTVLCCELHTGRYFNSDMETLRKAENTINAQLNKHDEATLDDFYYLIGLPQTTGSGGLGWTSAKLLELEFSAVLTDNKPCMAFSYNYVKAL